MPDGWCARRGCRGCLSGDPVGRVSTKGQHARRQTGATRIRERAVLDGEGESGSEIYMEASAWASSGLLLLCLRLSDVVQHG